MTVALGAKIMIGSGARTCPAPVPPPARARTTALPPLVALVVLLGLLLVPAAGSDFAACVDHVSPEVNITLCAADCRSPHHAHEWTATVHFTGPRIIYLLHDLGQTTQALSYAVPTAMSGNTFIFRFGTWAEQAGGPRDPDGAQSSRAPSSRSSPAPTATTLALKATILRSMMAPKATARCLFFAADPGIMVNGSEVERLCTMPARVLWQSATGGVALPAIPSVQPLCGTGFPFRPNASVPAPAPLIPGLDAQPRPGADRMHRPRLVFVVGEL